MDLVEHYGRDGSAYEAIASALIACGVDPEQGPVPPEALSGADEFHLGGAAATAAVIESLRLTGGERVLDVGCGVGGPARSMAVHTGCRVSGLDLTPAFVEAAVRLSDLTGLEERTSFRVGDAADLDDADASYDAATMFHVGMNLPDKVAAFAEVWRVLRPGGRFVVYDVMRTGPGELEFPLPWSATPANSHLSPPDEYLAALGEVGFETEEPIDRRELVAAALAGAAADPPPVNLVHLMGPTFPTMIGNLRAAFGTRIVSAVQVTARR